MNDPTGMYDRRRGIAAVERGDYGMAVQALSRRVAIAPHDVEALCKLGWSHSQCNQHSQALSAVEAALRRQPNQAEVRFCHGAVLARAGRIPEARLALQHALRLNPKHSLAQSWLQNLGAAASQPGAPSPRSFTRSAGQVGCVVVRLGFSLLLFMLVGAVTLVSQGRQMQQEEREFRHPILMTYDEFVRARPGKGWYRISGAALNLTEAVYWYNRKKPQEISQMRIPIRSAHSEPEPSAHCVFQTRRSRYLNTLSDLQALEASGEQAQLEQYLRDHLNEVSIQGEIEGIVQTGVRVSDYDNKEVAKLHAPIDADAVVLDDERPTPGQGQLYFNIGLMLFGVLGLILLTVLTLWIRAVRSG